MPKLLNQPLPATDSDEHDTNEVAHASPIKSATTEQDAPATADPKSPAAPHDTPPVTDIVHDLHAGRRSAADLSPDVRRDCVAHLTYEGFNAPQIAELMRISERTVCRDRAAARKQAALAPSRTLGDELLGEYHHVTLASVSRLIRLARETQTPAYARLWAEEAISRMYHRLMQTAHRMGYFETGQIRLTRQRRQAHGQTLPPLPDLNALAKTQASLKSLMSVLKLGEQKGGEDDVKTKRPRAS